LLLPLFFLMLPRPPTSTLFPYTTLFRSIPTLDQSKITNLVSDLSSKLTATKAAHQAHSSAEDLEALVSDFNDLIDKLIAAGIMRSEEHTSELQSRENLVCRLLLEKKKK